MVVSSLSECSTYLHEAFLIFCSFVIELQNVIFVPMLQENKRKKICITEL